LIFFLKGAIIFSVFYKVQGAVMKKLLLVLAVSFLPVQAFAGGAGDSRAGGMAVSNFSQLHRLSFNQEETAKTFDRLSLASSGDMENIINSVSAGNGAQQRDFLSGASGYFLANVIRSTAFDGGHNEIYDRIKNHCRHNETNTGIWSQAAAGQLRYGGDENSPGRYEDLRKGILAGYDRYAAESKVVLGIYGKYKEHDINQKTGNSASLKDMGFGVYGGYAGEICEIKILAAASYDEYETARYVSFAAEKAKADFSGYTYGGDVEGALNIALSESVNVRPYAGIEAKNASYENFKEKGAQPLNLEVKNGDYLRSAGRAGVSAGFDNKTFGAYAGAEAKYLITGAAPEIEAAFEGTRAEFTSRGYGESLMMYGAGAGASVRIFKGLKIFANAGYYETGTLRSIYGNAGIRYAFCGGEVKAGKAKNEMEEAKKKADTAAQKEQSQRLKNEEAFKKRLAEMRARQAAEEEQLLYNGNNSENGR
jgi:hypothetical protein